ncbi:MAG TPA: biotin/lipoate--protein ligase family protein [Azospirillum sp.]|nr:biotin/lipoate--protein ligase family protein [Azospirillum sp.]
MRMGVVVSMDAPRLPPVFRPVAIAAGDPLRTACSLGEEGAEAGTLVWVTHRERLDCAVVIEPDRPLDRARPALLVALLALADALGAAGPPQVAVGLTWPDRIEVNGALVGGVRFEAPPDDGGIPAWAVVGATVDVLGNPDDDSPGRHAGWTALREEGFGEVDATSLLEGFARHLLSWMELWENEGFAPIRAAWSRRGAELEETGALLTDDGRRLDLGAATGTPTWSMPWRPPSA